MNSWQADIMWEQETAALWERLNAPDPMSDELQKAAKPLTEVVAELNKAADLTEDAAQILHGTPMQYRLESLVESIESLRCEIRELAEKYRRGVRE